MLDIIWKLCISHWWLVSIISYAIINIKIISSVPISTQWEESVWMIKYLELLNSGVSHLISFQGLCQSPLLQIYSALCSTLLTWNHISPNTSSTFFSYRWRPYLLLLTNSLRMHMITSFCPLLSSPMGQE